VADGQGGEEAQVARVVAAAAADQDAHARARQLAGQGGVVALELVRADRSERRGPEQDRDPALGELLREAPGLGRAGEDQPQPVEVRRLLEQAPDLAGAVHLHHERDLAVDRARHRVVVDVGAHGTRLLVLLVLLLLELLALLLGVLLVLLAVLLGLLEVLLELGRLLGDPRQPLLQLEAVIHLGLAVAPALLERADEAVDLGHAVERIGDVPESRQADRARHAGILQHDRGLGPLGRVHQRPDAGEGRLSSGLDARRGHASAQGLLAPLGRQPGVQRVDRARRRRDAEVLHAAGIQTQARPGIDEAGAGDLALDHARALGNAHVGADGDDHASLDQEGRVGELLAGAEDEPLDVDRQGFLGRGRGRGGERGGVAPRREG